MAWPRTVTGIQLHHVTDLADAGRFLANAAAALSAAHTRTEDVRYAEWRAAVIALAAEVRELEAEARTRLEAVPADEFARCRDGELPWPDEVAEGFTPRHTCHDRCLYHDAGVLAGITQCICARPPCRACASTT